MANKLEPTITLPDGKDYDVTVNASNIISSTNGGGTINGDLNVLRPGAAVAYRVALSNEIPSDVLTTANYATTLDGVYEEKSDATSAHDYFVDKINDLTTAVDDQYTKAETDSKLSAKQDKLVSGTNIKTVNGSSLLGSGNVTISAQDSRIYDYTGETYGHCYGISSPESDYSIQIGESGFTVDWHAPYAGGDEVNLLQVDSDKFTYDGNQVITSGNLKTINGNSLVGSGNISVTASVSKATTSTIGGIKAANVRSSAVTTTQGSSQHLYGVELDSNGKAFVNVPWTDTTYPNALNVDSSSSNYFYGYRYSDNNWGIEIRRGSVGNWPSIGLGGWSQKDVSAAFIHSSGESNYFLVVRGSKALIARVASKSNTGFTVMLYNPEATPTTANDIYVDWIGVKIW